MTTTHTPKKPFWTQGTTIAAILVGGFLLIGIVFFAAMTTFGSDDDYKPMTVSEERRMNELLDEGNRTIAETAFEYAFLSGSSDGQDALCTIFEIDPEGSYEYMLTQVENVNRRDLSFTFYNDFLSANC